MAFKKRTCLDKWRIKKLSDAEFVSEWTEGGTCWHAVYPAHRTRKEAEAHIAAQSRYKSPNRPDMIDRSAYR